jgi:hypothetical protein
MVHKKAVSHTSPLPGMSREEWDRVRVSSTAAQLKAIGCVTESDADCCSDENGGTCCQDHDEDCKKVREIRDKSLKGNITAKDIEDHSRAEIRAKAKGLLS